MDGAAYGPARRKGRQRRAGPRHEPVERLEALALLRHALREALELVPRREPASHAVRAKRATADRAVATAGLELRAERLPDPRVEVTPARHLLAQLDDATIEGVDRRLLLGELLFEGASLYRELPELHPIPDERAECRDRHRDPGERGESRGPGEVEADNAGAVAANDEQAELLAAGPATSAPWVCRWRVSGVRYRPRYRPGQAVSRRFLVTHEA